ncbi:Triosephosphate isomerase [Bienertia sinuspersici]
MAGLQYKFFPTDFFVPTFEPTTVVDSSPKYMPLIHSNDQIDDSDETIKNRGSKFNNKKIAKISLSSSTDSNQRSIKPVIKKD